MLGGGGWPLVMCKISGFFTSGGESFVFHSVSCSYRTNIFMKICLLKMWHQNISPDPLICGSCFSNFF